MMLGLIASDLLLQRQQMQQSYTSSTDCLSDKATGSDDRTKPQPVATPAPAKVEDVITIDDDDGDNVEAELGEGSSAPVDHHMEIDTDEPIIQDTIREEPIRSQVRASAASRSNSQRKRKRVIDDDDEEDSADSDSSDDSPTQNQAPSTNTSNKAQSVSKGAPATECPGSSSRSKRSTANYNTIYIEDTDESRSDSEVNVEVEASSKSMKGHNSYPFPRPMSKAQPTINSVSRVSILERPKNKSTTSGSKSNSTNTNLKSVSTSSSPSTSDPTHPTHPTTVQTLIICPMTLISQWVEEIRTKLAPGVMSVYMYYGNERHISSDQLRKHDVIVTSYGTLISDAKIHQKHLASIDSAPSIKSLLSPFHNAPNLHSSSSSSSDCRRTTTANAAGVSGGKGLFGIAWHRVVLDEAHTIKVSILWMWAII